MVTRTTRRVVRRAPVRARTPLRARAPARKRASKARVVYSKPKQTGTRKSLRADRKRTALPPGKRVSKNGLVYYEYRRNRTDKLGTRI